MEENRTQELTPFQIALAIESQNRRITALEKDVSTIKPIVYDTAGSVKQIEKSVTKMEKNSETIRNYFLGAIITAVVGGVIGIFFLAVKSGVFGG